MSHGQDMFGEDMVRNAIMLAKRYGCHIVGKVRFIREMVGGRVVFDVMCDGRTYQGFYEYGRKRAVVQTPTVTEKDMKGYEAMFGTRECVDEGFEKRFWFSDNWNGTIHEFKTLRKAVNAARKQYGNCIYIYENFPYGRMSRIAKVANASGIILP